MQRLRRLPRGGARINEYAVGADDERRAPDQQCGDRCTFDQPQMRRRPSRGRLGWAALLYLLVIMSAHYFIVLSAFPK